MFPVYGSGVGMPMPMPMQMPMPMGMQYGCRAPNAQEDVKTLLREHGNQGLLLDSLSQTFTCRFRYALSAARPPELPLQEWLETIPNVRVVQSGALGSSRRVYLLGRGVGAGGGRGGAGPPLAPIAATGGGGGTTTVLVATQPAAVAATTAEELEKTVPAELITSKEWVLTDTKREEVEVATKGDANSNNNKQQFVTTRTYVSRSAVFVSIL